MRRVATIAGQAVAAVRARPGTAAIVCVGICWGLVMHSMGWAQLAHFAQVRAFADGDATIDRYHWETKDKAWVDGHFYSVKAPGTAALSLPAYLALDAAGAWNLADDATRSARETEFPRWAARYDPPLENYGYDFDRARAVEATVERGAPMIWALTLLVAVVPGVLLLIGVRRVADRLQPGYGTAAAVTLGLGTIVMTFASEYFSHVIAAALGFAAFMVLIREREGPPRAALVAIAGLLAGLAVTFEYQVGLVGVVLFGYALARSEAPRPSRAAFYGGAALLGALPALAFNWWALGAPFDFAYGSAVEVQGITGHDHVGLNDDGLFGITAPKLDSAVELLLGDRGLITLTPVIAAAIAGVVFMRRAGHRAEANAIAAIGLVYFVYNAGYWLPFGGGTPGPRFLIPALPFLALGLAFAYRRLPATTLALAIPSVLFMGAAAISFPLLGEQGPGEWADFIEDAHLEHTLLTALGVSNAWLAIAPAIAAGLAGIWFAARATPGTVIVDLRIAAAAVAAWAALAIVGPTIAGSLVTPLDGDPNALKMILLFALVSLLALGAIALRGRAGQPRPGGRSAGGPAEPAPAAAGERSS
jgi:hypothetical protein